VTWLRLDDAFRQHPKILPLTPAQRWAWVDAMLWAAAYSEDTGLLPDVADKAVPGLRKLRPVFRDLGLIDVTDTGDEIHDWLLYTGASIEAKVAWCLDRNPDASANEIVRKVGGNRKHVLDAVAKARETRIPPSPGGSNSAESVPGVPAVTGGSESATSPRTTRTHDAYAARPGPTRTDRDSAAAETHGDPEPNPNAAAAAATITTLLDRCGVQGDLRTQSLTLATTGHHDRIERCLRAALDRADRNPAGLYRTLLDSGETPNLPGQPAAAANPVDVLEARIRNLAHALTLTDVEREIVEHRHALGDNYERARAHLIHTWQSVHDPEPTPAT
jgi:hypothetical protein